jgi:hypothetical protein
MIRNAVMDPQGDTPREQLAPVLAVRTPAEVDVVLALVRAVNRPGSALEQAARGPIRRPFDAQYWACWLVTTLFPVVLVYLWVTH